MGTPFLQGIVNILFTQTYTATVPPEWSAFLHRTVGAGPRVGPDFALSIGKGPKFPAFAAGYTLGFVFVVS